LKIFVGTKINYAEQNCSNAQGYKRGTTWHSEGQIHFLRIRQKVGTFLIGKTLFLNRND